MLKGSILIVALCLVRLTYGRPDIIPPDNQFIAYNSPDNITYTCTVPSGRSAIWEVSRSQIRSASQFDSTASIGIIIDPMNDQSSESTITITQMARNHLGTSQEIPIACLSVQGISTKPSDTYSVINFFPPDVPGNLVLIPDISELTLEWDRPTNVPPQIPITYLIEINSTEENGTNFPPLNTTSTSMSIHFIEELLTPGDCYMFEFYVSGSNEAGSGSLAWIVDTVPISPDVTNISRSLAVENVAFQPFQVGIAFPPVIPCSLNFPLHNYTIKIDGAIARLLTPTEVSPSSSDGFIRPTLSASHLSDVALDSSFSLTVTACNSVTCRTSDPVTLYTTDVQRAEVTFFENRVYIRCFFAENSQAQGCAIVFNLASTNETERLDVDRAGEEGLMCTRVDNQKDAYKSVEAFDLEDGDVGSVNTNISVIVLMDEEEYVRETGCKEPVDRSAAVVAGVLSTIFLSLIIILLVIGVIVGVFIYRSCNIVDTDDCKFNCGEKQHDSLNLDSLKLDQQKRKKYIIMKTDDMEWLLKNSAVNPLYINDATPTQATEKSLK